MKERPILFSGPMVRAIMEGRKTMTRRVVKNSINELHIYGNPVQLYADWPLSGLRSFADGVAEFEIQCAVDDYECEKTKCPYGVPGGRLWVRETFAEVQPYYSASDEIPDWVNYVYRADYSDFEASPLQFSPNKWKPSIFMPRTASRILLEIESIRVERLQDITEKDAVDEGVNPLFTKDQIHKPHYRAELDLKPMPFKNYTWRGVGGDDSFSGYSSCATAKESFQSLWLSINGPESWEQNPWVWVIGFKRV